MATSQSSTNGTLSSLSGLGWTRDQAEKMLMAPRRTTLLLATLAIWCVAWVVWTADVLVEPVPFALERAARRLPLCLAGAGLCMALASVLSRVSPTRRGRLVVVAIAGVVACSIAFAAANEIVFFLILPQWGPSALVHIPDVAMMDGWVFLAWTLLFFALSADAGRHERDLALVQSEAAALDAQHRLLVSQAQPHFMFNALNAIYALVLDEDPASARSAILTLSAYLRRSLENPDRLVTIGDEVAFARDYLGVEKLRFGDRLRVREQVPKELFGLKVPSLMLQPLVENSVKHGLSDRREPVTVSITATMKEGTVLLAVEDDGCGGDGPGGSAIGLASLERRLVASFGTSAQITATASGRGYRVDLTFPAIV